MADYKIGKTGNTKGRAGYKRKKKEDEDDKRPRARPKGSTKVAAKQDPVGAGSNQAYAAKYRTGGVSPSGKGSAAAATRPAPRPGTPTVATTAASEVSPKPRPAVPAATAAPRTKAVQAMRPKVRPVVPAATAAPQSGGALQKLFAANRGVNERKALQRQRKSMRKG